MATSTSRGFSRTAGDSWCRCGSRERSHALTLQESLLASRLPRSRLSCWRLGEGAHLPLQTHAPLLLDLPSLPLVHHFFPSWSGSTQPTSLMPYSTTRRGEDVGYCFAFFSALTSTPR